MEHVDSGGVRVALRGVVYADLSHFRRRLQDPRGGSIIDEQRLRSQQLHHLVLELGCPALADVARHQGRRVQLGKDLVQIRAEICFGHRDQGGRQLRSRERNLILQRGEPLQSVLVSLVTADIVQAVADLRHSPVELGRGEMGILQPRHHQVHNFLEVLIVPAERHRERIPPESKSVAQPAVQEPIHILLEGVGDQHAVQSGVGGGLGADQLLGDPQLDLYDSLGHRHHLVADPPHLILGRSDLFWLLSLRRASGQGGISGHILQSGGREHAGVLRGLPRLQLGLRDGLNGVLGLVVLLLLVQIRATPVALVRESSNHVVGADGIQHRLQKLGVFLANDGGSRQQVLGLVRDQTRSEVGGIAHRVGVGLGPVEIHLSHLSQRVVQLLINPLGADGVQELEQLGDHVVRVGGALLRELQSHPQMARRGGELRPDVQGVDHPVVLLQAGHQAALAVVVEDVVDVLPDLGLVVPEAVGEGEQEPQKRLPVRAIPQELVGVVGIECRRPRVRRPHAAPLVGDVRKMMLRQLHQVVTGVVPDDGHVHAAGAVVLGVELAELPDQAAVAGFQVLLQGVDVPGPELAHGVLRVGQAAYQPPGGPVVVGDVLLVLGVHSVHLLVRELLVQQRRLEKLGKLIQRPLKPLLIHPVVVHGLLLVRVRIRRPVVHRQVLVEPPVRGVLLGPQEDHVL
mmetsp:Transcript_89195/g.238969  ORF Transcript_89195/g.238969 Transcript_89195/m.238969 type:complete len:685 (-) Transcript_89195:357-2411(-)